MLIWLQNWFFAFIVGPGGYVALFLFGALATTIIPLSPEVMAIGVWKLGMPVAPTIIILTIGNYIGNVINYFIGLYGGDFIFSKFIKVNKKSLTRSHKLFEKFGPPILFFSWIPIIGDPLTFVPGIVRYSFIKFSIYVIAGKTVRYLGLYFIYRQFLI